MLLADDHLDVVLAQLNHTFKVHNEALGKHWEKMREDTHLPSNVVRGGEYIRFIKAFRQQVITVEQLDQIIARFHNDRLPATFATRRQHIANLQSRRREPTIGRSCPRCGNQMVLRTAKQGKNAGNQFWGCSTYPRCKAVENAIPP